MGGHCPEGYITGPKNMRAEETSWRQRTKEEPFEGGHGPEQAAAPYMNGDMEVFKSKKSYNKTLILKFSSAHL
jgi:hypothetical protein